MTQSLFLYFSSVSCLLWCYNVSEAEIDSELDREEYELQRLEEIERQKEEEHEEYLRKLDKRFNNNED